MYFGGTAMGKGILVTNSVPSSFCMMKALLKLPSILSIALMGEEVLPTVAATAHSWSMSNRTCLWLQASVSLTRKRPFVYRNSSSRLIALPRLVMDGACEACCTAELALLKSFLRAAAKERASDIAACPRGQM